MNDFRISEDNDAQPKWVTEKIKSGDLVRLERAAGRLDRWFINGVEIKPPTDASADAPAGLQK